MKAVKPMPQNGMMMRVWQGQSHLRPDMWNSHARSYRAVAMNNERSLDAPYASKAIMRVACHRKLTRTRLDLLNTSSAWNLQHAFPASSVRPFRHLFCWPINFVDDAFSLSGICLPRCATCFMADASTLHLLQQTFAIL